MTSKASFFTSAAAALPILLLPALASAQANPTFTFAKPEEVKVVEWKAQAKAGGMLASGNSRAESAALGLTASRKEGNNKLSLDGGLAYGRSSTAAAAIGDPMMPLVVTGVDHPTATTTNNWFSKGRYDRFFTANNAGYVSAQAAGDKIAGKEFFGGGQLGYSRQLFTNAMNLVVAEIGYDFSYETYVQQMGRTLDPVSVHSARLFVGETLKLSAATGITGSVEAMFNVNKEGKALNVDTKTTGVDAFKDTRVIGKLALTTTLWKALSISFGFTLRYDQNPAPLPLPASAPGGAAFAPTFVPFAETVDTLTEATLIYTFL